MKNFFYVVVGILLIDVMGFIAWVSSGQVPVDNFYFGTITKHVIGLFI